ncbi:hypothetical protein L7F22_058283 [Adiantum nelumboides]|nr:hypothetical protein [Adiantum nelumboides]
MRDMEIKYCRDAIAVDSANESPWRYLKGLFKDDNEAFVRTGSLADIIIRELEKSKECIFALDLLLDLLNLGYEPPHDLIKLLGLEKDACSTLKMAALICTYLKEIDGMRVLYWDWRLAALVGPSDSSN